MLFIRDLLFSINRLYKRIHNLKEGHLHEFYNQRRSYTKG